MPTSRLTVELRWDAAPTGGAEVGTWGELTIALDGVPLWGTREGTRARGAHWTWIDLLEHLAEVWPWLMHEEGWPRAPGLERWSPEEAAAADDGLYEHRFRHDLAMAIRGKVLPPLWIVREGSFAWVRSERASARIELDEIEAVLRSLGDRIAGRLAELDDERARDAVHDWVARSRDLTPDDRAAVALHASRSH